MVLHVYDHAARHESGDDEDEDEEGEEEVEEAAWVRGESARR